MEKNDVIIISLLLIVIIVCIGFYIVMGAIKIVHQESKLRASQDRQWLFDALYSINNKVVLPENHEIKEEDSTPVRIYSPSADPVNSLKGMRNDWHGEN
jgi:hypothetical protein